jgi:transcriptional regulator with XRE-family HTH domain
VTTADETTQDGVDAMTGDELKRWRMARGWSRAKLADVYGCTDRSILNYESGKRPVPRPLANRIRALTHTEGAGATTSA